MIPEIDFVSLGMFIIDEIYDSEGTQLGTDLAGGAGTYALIGARVFYESPASRKTAVIIDIGNDFPDTTLETLNSLDCSLLLRQTPHRRTTRGLNTYGPGELRNFEYMTPKLRLDAVDLSPELLASKTFHLICNPIRCQSMVNKILRRRADQGIRDRPMILWEPVPGVCSPQDWADCIDAMGLVDVVSPNINEAASFHNSTIDEEQSFPEFKKQVESLTQKFIHYLNPLGAVIFRCGKHGCLVVTSGGIMKWLPAYHQTSEKVVDPTGGGNAFCGGFCAGYVLSRGDMVEAAKFGNIAAGIVIEQFGLPRLEYRDNGREEWNGDSVIHRRHVYYHFVEKGKYGE